MGWSNVRCAALSAKGTVVEPGLLDDRRNNYLMAVSVDARGTQAGIAYCDIYHGRICRHPNRRRDRG